MSLTGEVRYIMDWENLNFVPEEFACRCGCSATEIKDDFVLVLQEIRSSYGKSMHVTSGYRCAAHPVERKKVDRGGKPGSHYSGYAADIACVGQDAMRLLRISLNNPKITGIGVKQSGPHNTRFIHLDMLQEVTNRPTIWSY